jgi:hypothetical protein
MSYSTNIDYTGTGRVEVKIQVIADNHEKAFKTAQNILNQQKSWYRKHKEEALRDQKHYKRLLQYGPNYDDDNSKLNHLNQQQLDEEGYSKDKELANKYLRSLGIDKGIM